MPSLVAPGYLGRLHCTNLSQFEGVHVKGVSSSPSGGNFSRSILMDSDDDHNDRMILRRRRIIMTTTMMTKMTSTKMMMMMLLDGCSRRTAIASQVAVGWLIRRNQ